MRKTETYYKSLIKEVENFLKILDNEEFVLRQVMKSKEFKAYLKDKLTNEQIPPLFLFDEKQRKYIYTKK